MDKFKKRTTILIVLAVFFFSASSKLISGTITTAEIVSRSMSIDCLEWKIAGICFWLKCSFFGCYIVTTPKISHRLPDLAVASYPQSTETPWTQMRSIFNSSHSPAFSTLSGGNITGIGNELLHQESLQFNEVDVIGNPAANILDFGRFLCKSVSKPLFPYFVSLIDHLAWRSGLPDGRRDEANTPGEREIGNWPNHTWGSVYPRAGFVFQSHPGKAAAVSSQRAIDVVLGDNTGHIANDFSKNGFNVVKRGNANAKSESDCARSGGRWHNRESDCRPQSWYQWLPRSDESTDRWQMILPTKSESCETFGESETWPHSSLAHDGKYMWNYWAKYKCCVKAGGILLSDFDF